MEMILKMGWEGRQKEGYRKRVRGRGHFVNVMECQQDAMTWCPVRRSNILKRERERGTLKQIKGGKEISGDEKDNKSASLVFNLNI